MLKSRQIFKNRLSTADKPFMFFELAFMILFILSLIIKCIYFHRTTLLGSGKILSHENIVMMGSTLGAILIVLSVWLFLNRGRNIAFFVINVLLTVVLISDTLYFRYYYNVVSVPVLTNLKLINSVGDSAISLLRKKDLIYVIDLPFFLAGLIYLYKKSDFRLSLSKRAIAFAVVAVLGVVSLKLSYSQVDTSTFKYDNNYIVRSTGLFYFHYYDVKNYIKDNVFASKKLTAEEKSLIDAFYKNKAASAQPQYNGIAKGKNLIMVQVEALQEFVINRKVNGREITPNMNKLLKENTYFNNLYYQVRGGNTSDAEFLSNVSLYPLKEGAVYFRYPNRTYDSLPKILKQQGYTSYVSHANNASFWNRSTMYNSLGFDKFFSAPDYKMDELIGYAGYSLSDESFFRQTLDKIDTSKPFYSFMISISSHHPYGFFENYQYKDFNVGDMEKTYLGRYLKSVNYVDSCIGKLVEDLKKRGLYDNTLLMIYGDHYAIPKTESTQMMNFLGLENNEYEWTKLLKVPFIIHCSGLPQGQTIETVSGEIDIMPTIANLMGFEAPHAMGNDLFNTKEGFAIIKNNTLVTDKFIYLIDEGNVYDARKNVVLNKNDYLAEIEKHKDDTTVADIIIKKDAFRKK